MSKNAIFKVKIILNSNFIQIKLEVCERNCYYVT